jgi:predicted SprT family Zn-dependent metalloprotease
MEDYKAFYLLFNLFNEKLFKNTLPPVIITLSRKRGCSGYFSPERFENTADKKLKKDEIALNPDVFSRGKREVSQTIVHEMCHLWQHHFGLKKSKHAYHNREWGAKMEEVGLIPSSTGAPGGKKTGLKVADYIDPKGLFSKVVDTIDSISIEWEGKALSKKKNPKTIFVYTCPNCKQKAYAKADVSIVCGPCEVVMMAAEEGGQI